VAEKMVNVRSQKHMIQAALLVFLAALAFSALFAWVNYAQYQWLSSRFEANSSPTSWGILQRLFLIIPAAAISIWKPRQVGFQIGKTFQHWRTVLIILVINVAVIAAYLLLSGGTPYSGSSMLINEVITVPLVEEIMWRGFVFAALLAVLRRFSSEKNSGILAGVYSGVCFGLLHATNALAGYPAAFVALQTLNATVWGVVYGIVRAKTESIYPPILFHAAMNLAVVLI